MATRSGDGQEKESVVQAPEVRRIPVSSVQFKNLTSLPGTDIMLHMATSMTRRILTGGQDYTCPQIWWDKEIRCICIGNRRYPAEEIKWWDQANTVAKETDLRPGDTERYTVTAPVRRIVK